MTGFGEGRASSERLEVTATLRSVNHRFLDLAVRMPEEYRVLESELVQKVRDALGRGRVELRLNVRQIGPREIDVVIDEDLAERYVEVAKRLGDASGELTGADLLRLPEVVVVQGKAPKLADLDRQAIASAVEQSLERLVAARSKEGGELASVLERIVGELGAVVAKLDASRQDLQRALFEKTLDRLRGFSEEVGVDESRVAQEVALLVDRADVQEEIDRLKVHLGRFEALLSAKNPVGKRLDFLAQEILRELNTIGSKGRTSESIQLVLDGKSRCEQLREQVQNVE